MKYVLGPTWTMYTTSAMCIHLNHWIQFITDQLRTELGIEYESESENDLPRFGEEPIPMRPQERLTVLGVNDEIGETASDRSVYLWV